MKNRIKNHHVTCTNIKRPKTYVVAESKKKPGFAICPACGEYHPSVPLSNKEI